MTDFQSSLIADMELIDKAGLSRKLRIVDSPQGPTLRRNGRELLNFSSNDYLGLANSPRLKEAAKAAVDQYGAGSGASRLISGSLQIHHELEAKLAALKGTPAALSFGSGYLAALATLPALCGKQDTIILDKLAHACLIDSARLSGAVVRVFPHNDMDKLERLLKTIHAKRTSKSRVIIVTESLFSMDGDFSPLEQLVDLKDRFESWLFIDEAHATGTYGGGLIQKAGLTARVEVQMGTLGKALGSAGGFICGSQSLIDYLINRARSFIFTTAPVPAAAAAAREAVSIVMSQEGERLRERLFENIRELTNHLAQPKSSFASASPSPIIPLMIGAESAAVECSARLAEAGFFIPAIRFPAVARNKARLRLTLSAAHTSEQVRCLASTLSNVL